MKRFLILLGALLFFVNAVSADEMDVFSYANTNMKNFWSQNGKKQEKILEVGTKLINANKLDKRIAIQMIINNNTINAKTSYRDKTVSVYSGILPYMDNDDELAFVMGHEMGHALDAYQGGAFKWLNMQINSKEYEFNADLVGVDLMVKAGYNPIAAICVSNKFAPEDYWDFWIFTSHPKTSRRLLKIYEYIYVKYPWALQTDMVHNVNFENFTYAEKEEINAFVQHERERVDKQDKGDM